MYSAGSSDPLYNFPAGQYGIVIDSDTKVIINIGDVLNVTTDDCSKIS